MSLITASLAAHVGIFDQMPKVLKDPKHAWGQTISVGVITVAWFVTCGLTILGSNPAFWYLSTLALILANSLIMVISLILSFPVFDVHRVKAKSGKA